MDDAELLIRRLYVDHSEALLSWALGQVSDQRDAEEVVSDTLVKAWRRYDQYDAKRGSERSWIFGIARNTAIDRHRKSKRHLRLVDDEALAGSDDGGIEALAEASVVRDALNELPAHHRTVIVEAFFLGKKVSEIADKLEIPAGTVKSRMYYGVRALRAALEEKELLR